MPPATSRQRPRRRRLRVPRPGDRPVRQLRDRGARVRRRHGRRRRSRSPAVPPGSPTTSARPSPSPPRPARRWSCSIDTGTPSFGPCSGAASHQPAADLADGNYTFRVRATDAAGNSATDDAERSRSIDITPPSLVDLRRPDRPDERSAPDLHLHGRARRDVQCSIDTGTASYGPCSGATGHQPASDLADGATSSASGPPTRAGTRRRRRRASASTRPRRRCRSPAARPATTDRAAADLQLRRRGRARPCSARSTPAAGSFGPCSGAASHQPAADLRRRDYTFRVRATDAAANSTTQTRDFSVDTVAPTLSITGGPTGVTSDPRPAFTFDAGAGSAVECSIDTGTAGFGPCSGASGHQPASDLADGDYTFRVRATDAAANSTTRRATSASTPRRRRCRTPAPSSATNDARPTFSFTAGAGATLECSIDTGTAGFGPCSGASSHQPASDLADGSYTFRSGRPTPPATSATQTRGQRRPVAPSLSITGGPTGVTNDARPTFSFTAGAGAALECSLDTGSAVSVPAPAHRATSPPPISPTPPSPSGSVRPMPRATRRPRRGASACDTAAPSVSITGGPTGTTGEARPTFDFSAEAGATVECSVDTGLAGFGPCSGASSHQPASDLANGSYTFRVRATDAAGNSATKTRAFTVVDDVPPSLSITGGPNGVTNVPRPTFTFDAEAGATVQCSIDTGSASFGPCSGASSHQPATDLADGSYTFRVRATDGAGNPTTQTRAFSVDTTAPALSITGGPSSATSDARPSFTFTAAGGSTVTCSIDAGSANFGPCSGAGQSSAGRGPRERRATRSASGRSTRPATRPRRRATSASTRSRRRSRSPVARRERPATRGPRSPSTPRPLPPFSARSTPAARASAPARALRATSRPPTSRTAATPSASAPPTRPATSATQTRRPSASTHPRPRW